MSRKSYPELVFRVKAPCANCPFRKEGGIELAPGRLDGIIADLLKSDESSFHCHKTVYPTRPSKLPPAQCAGSLIYLEKVRRPSLLMRLGVHHGVYDRAAVMAHQDLILDPKE